MNPRPSHLDVFFGEEHVGSVHDTSPLTFEYTESWLGRGESMPLAMVPLASGRHSENAVQAFFENLLPEGELRHYIAEQKKSSTLFSLLLEVAGDTAGGFVLLPAGQTPTAPSYQATTWRDLRTMLERKSAAAIDIRGRGARISLAGAQDKAAIAIFDNHIPMLPLGTSPSTHILKPDIRRLAKVWDSAANEAFVMLTARHCGIPTAEVFYEPTTRSCVVKRFDRIATQGNRLARLVQYDMCQLHSTISEKKYEKEGGPGIEICATLIRKYSAQPAVDLRHLLNWIFFNLYTGNNDSHAKNLSILGRPEEGTRLAPLYDLMCTRIYPGLSQEFALSIGGESEPGRIDATHIRTMAEQLNIKPGFVLDRAQVIAKKLPGALNVALDELRPVLAPGSQTLVERVHRFILRTTDKIAKRLR
ncbi:MAG: type II toxin-antitoxin system HipA family toxin [Burkholderiales bacterium]